MTVRNSISYQYEFLNLTEVPGMTQYDTSTPAAHQGIRTGLSLFEVVLSTLIVGLTLVAALNTLGSASQTSLSTSDQAKAALLASDLMAEILATSYVDPDGTGAFGNEGTENPSGPREAFDDVDDYNGWIASPPQRKDGTELPGLAGWTRTVNVRHVNPDDLASVLAPDDDRGVKGILVAVERSGKVLTTLQAVQTAAWLEMIPEPGNNRTTSSAPSVNHSLAVHVGED